MAPPDPPPPAARPCLNCGAQVDDAFCPRCGQEYAGAGALSAALTFHDLIDDAVQVNRDFFRSAGLLVAKPGLLTQDYLAGRRARHISPSRLYLIVNFALFLMVQWFDPITADLAADLAGQHAFASAAREMGMSRADYGARVEAEIADIFPAWVIVLVPLVTVALMALYVGSRRTFSAHAVFALHGVAFVLVACMPGGIAPAAYAVTVHYVMLLGVLPLWLLLALRRVYGQGWALTALKAVALWVWVMFLVIVYYQGVVVWAVAPG